MRISRYRSKYTPDTSKRYRINQYIKVPEVRVIDENGENIGVMPTGQALALAEEKGMDLVEVSPVAQPPVAKIINYSKLKYEEEKSRRKQIARQKKVEVKGIRLSLRIGEHDQETRLKQAQKFLNDGDKVKVELILRGREKQHTALAREIIKKFVDSLQTEKPIKIEQPITYMGGKFSILISN